MIYNFEITITRNGKHYLAIPLGPDYGLPAAQDLVRDLQRRFPQTEGFWLSVTLLPARKEVTTALGFLTLKPGQHYLPPAVEAAGDASSPACRTAPAPFLPPSA